MRYLLLSREPLYRIGDWAERYAPDLSVNRRLAILLSVLLLSGGYSSLTATEMPSTEDRANAWLGVIDLPKKNCVEDGSFEDGGRGWGWFQQEAGGFDSNVVAGGTVSFRMGVEDPGKHFYYQQDDVPLETGETYTFSAMVKTEGLSEKRRQHGVLFLVNHGWTLAEALIPPETTMDWTRVSVTFAAPETQLRADGKPVYALIAYWPPKNKGQFWIDDVQIEQGSQATEYTDIFAGDAIVAVEKLRFLASEIFSTREAVQHFSKAQYLVEEVERILVRAAAIRDDLKRFNDVEQKERRGFVQRIDSVAADLARIKTVIWTGPAHVWMDEVPFPETIQEAITINAKCLVGEHRDIALNIANLTSAGYSARLVVSELFNDEFALKVSPLEWMSAYDVPLMGGYRKTNEQFTDALVAINRAGVFQVRPAAMNQVIISIDTSQLLPGDYRGTIAVASLFNSSDRQDIPVELTVLPLALLPVENLDIAECFGHTEYAYDAMIELGVNTFDLSGDWVDVEFHDDGGVRRIDFSRLDSEIRRALDNVPHAKFLLLSGERIWDKIQSRMGWTPEDTRFEKAFQGWTQALVDHLRGFNVTPDRLIMETYDEPGPGDYAAGTRMAQWIDQVDPAIQTLFYSSGIDINDAWKDNALAHDITGPIMYDCTPEKMEFLKALGKKIWVYDCQADGETLHPLAYYRLMPWTCRKYGIEGWGHWSWFNTSDGRDYRAWEGVEAQNVVYPTLDGKGMVISRRLLGIRAGTEDYRVLDALERVMSGAANINSQDAQKAATFIQQSYDQALSLAPRKRHYQKQISPDGQLDLLDQLREEAVERISTFSPGTQSLNTTLTKNAETSVVSASVPSAGTLSVRYLVDGKLPWRNSQQSVTKGEASIVLEHSGRINRCLVKFTGPNGLIRVGSPLIIPQIVVDSVHSRYSQRNLNDGICVEAVKFEPEFAWISASDDVEHWVEMKLGQRRQVSQVNLFWMTFTGLPQKTMVQYLDEAGDWKPVSATPSWRPATKPVERITFSPITTTGLRVLMDRQGGGIGGPTLMGLSEVEVK